MPGVRACPASSFPPLSRSLGAGAFLWCYSLKSIQIPDKVRRINAATFIECGLVSVSLPKDLTLIGERAFYGCKNLTSVLHTRESIGNRGRAFGYCKALTNVAVPGSVKIIGTQTFQCTGLCGVTLSEGVEEIRTEAFGHCENLGEITIPGSVKRVRATAFDYCKNLVRVVFREGVEEIGDSVFQGCCTLWDVTIPRSVKKIGSFAFFDCKMTEVQIPRGCNTGRGAFPQNCRVIEK